MKNLIIEKIVKKITKNILSEGSLDKPILDISREVIRLFKNEESDTLVQVEITERNLALFETIKSMAW